MHHSAMRPLIFGTGLLVIALGFLGKQQVSGDAGFAFLQGGLTLGGALLICGLFTLKMRWHGTIGAGVVALLGAARGIGNLPDLAKLIAGDRQRGTVPLLEAGITLACLVLLLAVLRSLQRERVRRMLEQE